MSGHRCSLTRSRTAPGVDEPLGGGAQDAAGRRHHQSGRHPLVGDVADRRSRSGRRGAGSRRRSRRPPRGPAGSTPPPASSASSGSCLGRKFCWISRATSSSCSNRCRVAASACCSRTSWPTRRAGAAWAARLSSSLRSSEEYSCSERRGPEVEYADQLALADQRHGQLDPGRLHLLERGGVAAPAPRRRRRRSRSAGRPAAGRSARCRPAPRRRASPARLPTPRADAARSADRPRSRRRKCGGQRRHGVTFLRARRPGIVTATWRPRGPAAATATRARAARCRGRPSRRSVLSASRSSSCAQPSGERLEGAGGVVPATVEAAVDDGLDAGRAAAGTGRRRPGSRRRRPGRSRRSAGAAATRSSSTEHEVRRHQGRGERAVDQGAVDDQVDVVEPVAQDRDAGRDRQRVE